MLCDILKARSHLEIGDMSSRRYSCSTCNCSYVNAVKRKPPPPSYPALTPMKSEVIIRVIFRIQAAVAHLRC